jgi:hypothetical protein
MRKRHLVVLSEAERARLHTLIGRGVAPASVLTHARVLLKANQGEAGPAWTDAAVATALEVHPATVARIRVQYAAAAWTPRCPARRPGGPTAGPSTGHPRPTWSRWRAAPHRRAANAGRSRLLAERLVALEVVEAISYETVRQALKQTGSSRG